MKAVVIEPLDVVSVRDGRSFDAGSASLARAVWPPSPWTILGAVRARLVLALGGDPSVYGGRGWVSGAQPPPDIEECVKRLGRPEDRPSFQLGPVLHVSNGKTLFPTPLDLVMLDSAGHGGLGRLRPEERSRYKNAAWSKDAREYVLMPPESGRPGKKNPPPHLTDSQAAEWLRGSTPKSEGVPSPVVAESRIGIAIDPATGRVQEGMFYQRQGFALRNGWRLLIPFLEMPSDFEQVLKGFDGLGEVGGDRRPAWFHATTFEWPKSPMDAGSSRGVLWFLTPVRPEDIRDEGLREAAGSQDLKVLAVASGRPVSIGGWRMWRGPTGVGRPRAMRRYYPAGTCVYVKGDVGRLHGRSVARDREERAAGFGVCLSGAWPVTSSNKEV